MSQEIITVTYSKINKGYWNLCVDLDLYTSKPATNRVADLSITQIVNVKHVLSTEHNK